MNIKVKDKPAAPLHRDSRALPQDGKKDDKRQDSEAGEDLLYRANVTHRPSEFAETNHAFGRKLSNSERSRPTALNHVLKISCL